MTAAGTADDPRLARWGSLRARWLSAQDELASLASEMDALLAEMCEGRPVSRVAADVGLSRQEVHRRIARARC